MAKWLTQDWLDEFQRMGESQPERPGMSASLQYTVTEGPEGDLTYYQVIQDGKLVEGKIGEHPDPEVKMTQTYQDALKIAKGELEPGAAFMQGKIKVDGDMAKVMSLLPMTNSPEYRQFQADLRAATEF